MKNVDKNPKKIVNHSLVNECQEKHISNQRKGINLNKLKRGNENTLDFQVINFIKFIQ